MHRAHIKRWGTRTAKTHLRSTRFLNGQGKELSTHGWIVNRIWKCCYWTGWRQGGGGAEPRWKLPFEKYSTPPRRGCWRLSGITECCLVHFTACRAFSYKRFELVLAHEKHSAFERRDETWAAIIIKKCSDSVALCAICIKCWLPYKWMSSGLLLLLSFHHICLCRLTWATWRKVIKVTDDRTGCHACEERQNPCIQVGVRTNRVAIQKCVVRA